MVIHHCFLLHIYYCILNVYIHKYMRLSVRLSVRPSVHLSVCPSVRLSICLSVRLSVSPSVCLSVSLSLCLSVSLSLCLFVSLFVCLPVCLSTVRCAATHCTAPALASVFRGHRNCLSARPAGVGCSHAPAQTECAVAGRLGYFRYLVGQLRSWSYKLVHLLLLR